MTLSATLPPRGGAAGARVEAPVRNGYSSSVRFAVAMAMGCVIGVAGCRREPAPYGYPHGDLQGQALPPSPVPAAPPLAAPPDATGRASYYADSLAGNSTASGEPYDPAAFTAAHRELPFGTIVEVRRRDTGVNVRVRINDRGPFGDARRIIDLSRRAAESLDMVRAGVVDVELRVVSRPP